MGGTGARMGRVQHQHTHYREQGYTRLEHRSRLMLIGKHAEGEVENRKRNKTRNAINAFVE